MIPRSTLGIAACLLAYLVAAAAHAQPSCNAIEAEYTKLRLARLHESRQCTINWTRNGGDLFAPWTRQNARTPCDWDGYKGCEGPASQCPAILEARDKALSDCRRREATLDAREHGSGTRRPSLQTPSDLRNIATQSSRQIGKDWAQNLPSYLLTRESPLVTVRKSPFLQSVGDAWRLTQHVNGIAETAMLALRLPRVLSGGSAEERLEAASDLRNLYAGWALTLRGDPGRVSTLRGNPAASVFSTYSFMILSNFQQAILQDLTEVRRSIELFSVTRTMVDAQQDMVFSRLQAQWRERGLELEAQVARRQAPTPAADFVSQLQADARAAANRLAAQQQPPAQPSQPATQSRPRQSTRTYNDDCSMERGIVESFRRQTIGYQDTPEWRQADAVNMRNLQRCLASR